MRTIEVKVFTFDELSDKAKQNAIETWSGGQEYFWGDEAIESLKQFVDHFNGNLSNWNIDFLDPYRNEYKLDLPKGMEDEEILNLILSLGSYNKDTLKGDGECKLSGYCMDESLGDGIRESWFNDGERDLRELVMAGINQWEIDVRKDCEYQCSEEYFAECCEANEYEFTEDGELI